MATSMPFPPVQLSEATVTELSEKAKSWVPHLLELAATDSEQNFFLIATYQFFFRLIVCSEGFKSLGTKNNVKIFVSATEGQRVHLTKGVTVVKATSETIKRCFIAPDNESFNHLFTVIDPMVSCTYVFMHWGVAREWILLGVHGFVRWRAGGFAAPRTQLSCTHLVRPVAVLR